MKSMLLAAAGLAAPFALTLASPAFAQNSADALGDAFCASVVAEDSAALAALYTEDADSYGPDGTVQKGRAEIAASWQAFFDGYDGFACTLDKKGGEDNGKNYTAWGLWTLTATPAAGGDLVTMNGRYMDISVKTKDGWRYKADHASMLAPATQ
ncbi:MAG: nuclear transport factor 2 family protein [Parvularculaceae bacterium]